VGCRFSQVPPKEAAASLASDLLAELPEVADAQLKTIQHVAALPCHRLDYDGTPQQIARELGVRLRELLAGA
jgi:hypothetical protein